VHAELAALMTPAALVDLDRMDANLARMADYTRRHDLRLRPHTKTHKSAPLARRQLELGAAGLTTATLLEAETMMAASPDLLLAHPPVGDAKLRRLVQIARHVRTTVALDSEAALAALAHAADRGRVEIGVLVELDLGMHRVGVAAPAETVALARAVGDAACLEFRGVLFYPGHIREDVAEQGASLRAVSDALAAHLDALKAAGLEAGVVSGGSTPTAFASHEIAGLTEIRPGTYIFNDRTTSEIGACAWEDCAYSVLATVVSTAVAGQAVVDAGSKALSREELRAPEACGFGALLDRPDVVVSGLSEEHGILDLRATDWRPHVGERVRIVPNHVCVSVNLQNRIWGIRGERIEESWLVEARGWSR
jgi:D-serine deaminase-like pyridoxal phosphate-dependent protein